MRPGGDAPPASALVWVFAAYLAMDYLRPHALQALKLQMLFVAGLPVLWLCSRRHPWSTTLTLQACYLVTGALMLPFARNNYEVYAYTRVMFTYFVTALATVWLMAYRKYFYRILWTFTAVLCVQAVYAISHAGRGYGDFLGDENDLAIACTLILPFGVVGFQVLTGRKRWVWGLVAILMIGGIIASFSRGGFLGMVAAVAYCIFFGGHRLRNLTVVVAAGTLLLLFASSYKGEMESISQTTSGTAETREFLWITATRMWLDHPIFGVGPYNATYQLGEYQPNFTRGSLFAKPEFHERDWSGTAIHSLYFEQLAERGLVGIGIFTSIAVLHFRMLRRLRRAARHRTLPADRRRDALFLSLALEGAMAGFLAAGAFLSMATYPHFWFLSAQASALDRWMRTESLQRPAPTRPRRPGTGGGALAAMAGAILLLSCNEARGGPPERRCVELGDGCHCAEALDFEGSVPASDFFDPPDSTQKECTQAGTPPPWYPVFLRFGGRGVVPGEPGGAPSFPPGATLKHVLRKTGSGGADSVMDLLYNDGSGGALDITGKTLCIRAYVSYSPDHPVPGNIKIARIGNASSGMAWQANWGGSLQTSVDRTGIEHSPLVSFIADLQGDGKLDVDCNLVNHAASERLTFGHCQKHWCRYEICADDTPSRPPDVRARWVEIGGSASLLQGPELNQCPYQVPVVDRLLVREQLMFLDLHGEQLASSANDVARYLSHALVTLTPYDPSFWPGPARECEGPAADSGGEGTRALP